MRLCRIPPAAKRGECVLMFEFVDDKKPRPILVGVVFLPFGLKQCGLRRVCMLTLPFGLFTLMDNALTVTGVILKQVECVWCEAEFILRNRQPALGSLHTGSPLFWDKSKLPSASSLN